VQSHWFSVGSVVSWAEPGVGAVATQSFAEPAYGPKGLALMKSGISATEAMHRLVALDPLRDQRQLGFVDATGDAATWTGKKNIQHADGMTGPGYAVQANLMANDKVWPAMAEAYEKAEGDLAERMMQALEAAEKAGGDIRGKQSAAMLIVKAEPSGKPWADRVIDLRVEDSDDPLKELRRLIQLRHAYNHVDAGDAHLAAVRTEEAMKAYEQGAKLAPDVVELQFWAALGMYTNGREKEGLALFREVFAKEYRWVDLMPRLVTAGLFPDDPDKMKEVMEQRPRGRLIRR
jgi:uncharacterized Ntn-hydrolase superfamily protein